MSLGGRFRLKAKAKGLKTRKFKVKGKLDPAEWAEFLEKIKALMKQYDIKITQIRDE